MSFKVLDFTHNFCVTNSSSTYACLFFHHLQYILQVIYHDKTYLHIHCMKQHIFGGIQLFVQTDALSRPLNNDPKHNIYG